MKSAKTDSPLLLDDESERLLDEFVVCQAAELARDGSYQRAESMLRPSIERPEPPTTALDLMARICAQEGRLYDAARLWQKVLDREPNNAAAQAALTKLNKIQRRPLWLATLLPILVGVCAVVFIVVITAWQSKRNAEEIARLRSEFAQAIDTRARSAERQIGEMNETLNSVATSLRETREQLDGSRSDLKSLTTQQKVVDRLIRTRLARIEERIMRWQKVEKQ